MFGLLRLSWELNREVTMQNQGQLSLLGRLFEPVPETPAVELGQYNPDTQTWSHRNSILMSPVKHNQEE